jgi:hypothetical protein
MISVGCTASSVERGARRAVFHAPWEAVVVAIRRSRAMGRFFNHRRVPSRHRAHGPGALPRPSYYERMARRPHAACSSKGRRGRSRIWRSARRPFARGRRRRPPARGQPRAFPTMGRAESLNFVRRRRRARRRASALPPGRQGRHAELPSAGPHATAALRARQAGCDPPAPRQPRVPGRERARPGGAAAAAVQRALRRPRALGRVGGAEPPVHLDLWESYLRSADDRP